MSDGLTPEDRKILQETLTQVTLLGQQLSEVRKVLFGEAADGFLYKFASMERDIKSIPKMKEQFDDIELAMINVGRRTTDLEGKFDPMEKKVSSHSRILLAQKVRNTLLILIGSAITSFLTMAAAIWAGVVEFVKSGQKPHIP